MAKRSRRCRCVLFGSGAIAAIVVGALVWLFLIAEHVPSDAIVVPRDFSTIQAAVDHASPGSTIIVRSGAGPFHESLEVLTPAIRILAVGGRAVIEHSSPDTAVIVGANNVTLSGLEIKTSGVGLRLEGVYGSLIDDVVIEKAKIGIQLLNSDSNSLSRISVRNGDTGIEMTSANRNTLKMTSMEKMSSVGLRLSNAWSNVIARITVTGSAAGISIEQGSEENRVSSGAFSDCSASGVEILSSSANALSTSTFTDCKIAVLLNSADNNTVDQNRMRNSLKCGISLYKSLQNTLSLNTITSGLKDGISLVDAQENAVTYNSIDSCVGTGITLESAKSNLVLGNKLTSNAIGIQGLSATENRVLRNDLRENVLAGTVLSEGEGNLLLDNVIDNSAYGIALIGTTQNQLLRNRVTNSSAEGISLINHANQNLLQDATIENNHVGVLIAASSRSTILNSTVTGGDIAVRLFQAGMGTRIERNAITNNSIGLEIAAQLSKDDTILRGSDVPLSTGEAELHLVLAHNTFAGNTSYDISNFTDNSVYAAGNYWDDFSGKSQGRVSDGVVLPRSAWVGTIALGSTASLDRIIMARMMQLLLSKDGFKVVDLIGLGGGDELIRALDAGDVDLALADPASIDAGDVSGEEIAVSPALDVENGLSLIVSSELEGKLSGNGIIDLAAAIAEDGVHLTLAVQKTISQEQVNLFASAYSIDLASVDVVWTDSIDETETLLKLATANACLVYRIEETLTLMGFTVLEDDQQAFPLSNTAFLARQSVIVAHPEIASIEQQLRSLLTTDGVHSLVSKVRLLHSDPAEVAREFMVQQGLIDQ